MPQEQEEAESRHGYYPPGEASGNKQAPAESDQDEADPELRQQDEEEQEGEDTPGKPNDGLMVELSDDQLIELIKNAHQLSPE